MTYKIEKTVPLPSVIGSGRVVKYPIREMEVGDSFRFVHDKALRSSIRASAYQAFRHTRKYTTQTVVEDGKRWFRIWRVK